jgi:hypothetical protein
VAARKWLVFAGAALASGTGEAKDLLEGLTAYLQGKQAEFESVCNTHLARAQLELACGTTSAEGAVKP